MSATDSESLETSTQSSQVAVLRAVSVEKTFGRGRAQNKAVRPTDLAVVDGRSLGIAGESGSGKSTLLRLLLDLERPSAGDIQFENVPIRLLSARQRHGFRAAVQAVFQDPGSSLDPRSKIWRSITEPAWATGGLDRTQRRELALRLLSEVDLPASFADRLPHQLSGGERQRVAIARALSSYPHVVLLDEPVTALDVSVRGAIINLLAARSDRITYVVVSHDLTVIAHLTDELMIMYQGYVVERGPTDVVLEAPLHPYTRALIASVDNPLYESGRDSDVIAPEAACPYINRCPHAFEPCVAMPPMTGDSHQVRCHSTAAVAPPLTQSTATSIRPSKTTPTGAFK